MKKIFSFSLIMLPFVTMVFSCKKENSCQGCVAGNSPPIAHAGDDKFIILPADSALLDGSR